MSSTRWFGWPGSGRSSSSWPPGNRPHEPIGHPDSPAPRGTASRRRSVPLLRPPPGRAGRDLHVDHVLPRSRGGATRSTTWCCSARTAACTRRRSTVRSTMPAGLEVPREQATLGEHAANALGAKSRANQDRDSERSADRPTYSKGSRSPRAPRTKTQTSREPPRPPLSLNIKKSGSSTLGASPADGEASRPVQAWVIGCFSFTYYRLRAEKHGVASWHPELPHESSADRG